MTKASSCSFLRPADSSQLCRDTISSADRLVNVRYAFSRMLRFIVGDVVEQQNVTVIENRAVNSLLRGGSVVNEFPIEADVGPLLRGDAVERYHLVAQGRTKVLQHEALSGARGVGLLERVLSIHA